MLKKPFLFELKHDFQYIAHSLCNSEKLLLESHGWAEHFAKKKND